MDLHNSELIEIVCCPFHKDKKLIIYNEGLKCPECKSIYKKLIINGNIIYNFLVTDKSQQWSRGIRELDSSLISKIQGKAFDRDVNLSSEIVVDVGCGSNPRGDINIDCYIPDPLPSNFILANIEFLPIKVKSVDVLTSYYNLEHLVNPAQFIQVACTIAKKKVAIITDNSDWIGDLIFRFIGKGRIFHDEHYYKWSTEYLDNLIHRTGINSYTVKAVNYSTNIPVSLISKFGKLPRIGNIFYRDIEATIYTDKQVNPVCPQPLIEV